MINIDNQTQLKSSDLMRPPDQVMRLKRIGAFHQTRLSFMQTLLRKLKKEQWTFQQTKFEINDDGEGYAVYQAKGPRRTYSLIAFAKNIPDHMRTDRVIATMWDATFCLYDGKPTQQDIMRLQDNVPKQEAGRISGSELCLSRANKSVRLWKHVVDRLSNGEQPDADLVENVGYLMRSTAVYGSGKFGAADRSTVEDRVVMSGPFSLEMLSVYLTRSFTLDLVEHMAKVNGKDKAVKLAPDIRHRFGIGNSTGLGMAPFLVNHPALLHSWISAREQALARIRALPHAEQDQLVIFNSELESSINNAAHWKTDHEEQSAKIETLKQNLDKFKGFVVSLDQNQKHYWNVVYQWAEKHLSLEGQELVVSLIIEPFGNLVDDLADQMSVDENIYHRINGAMSISELTDIINTQYQWALNVDYDQPENKTQFWYVSEEKLEPRLGNRFEEAEIKSYEQPLCIGRFVKSLATTLQSWSGPNRLADFLLAHPKHRHTVRRIQLTAKCPYAEIRDNLISEKMQAIDILRCKLSFFGATRFDPRSDRWVRICMYQNAPFPEELVTHNIEGWANKPIVKE